MLRTTRATALLPLLRKELVASFHQLQPSRADPRFSRIQSASISTSSSASNPDLISHHFSAPTRRNMAAPGHHGRNNDSRSARSGGKSSSLSLDGHRVDRPDVKAAYIDTHCHLFTTLEMMREKLRDESIPKDRIDLFAKQLFPENVKAVVDIHCDVPLDNYVEQAMAFTEWPENFKYYFAAGAHPHVAMAYTDEIHESLVTTMSNPRCVAWGECGLDFFKNAPDTHQTQKEVFTRQIETAISLNKPLVVHTRDADETTKEVLDKHMARDHPFHVHCFTSSTEFGRWVLETFPNSYIGITGVATYQLPHVQDFIRSGDLPLGRMLMETDSPFMTPRNIHSWLKKTRSKEEGKKRFAFSHSGMIPFTAELVAEWINEGRQTRGEEARTDVEEVLEMTRKNAEKIYSIEI